jgi:ATP-binding cassette subfamily G (WHITE) protein 1
MMNAMSILNVFGEEKSVFRRESGSGYYGVAAFFFSKIMIELPTAVFFGWTMATVIYWMVYLPANAATYFVSMVIIAITGMVGSLLGIALASMFDSLNVALAVTPMILLPLMVGSA